MQRHPQEQLMFELETCSLQPLRVSIPVAWEPTAVPEATLAGPCSLMQTEC